MLRVTDEDADEVYADPEKRKYVMKEVKHKYQKVITLIDELKKDWIHRLIRKSAIKMMENKENDEENDLDEKEAYAAGALEQLSLIKSAVSVEDDDESDSESDSDNDSDSSSSSSSSYDDSNDDTFFVDLFLEVVNEHYPEEDTHEKARYIVKDKNEMGVILPIIMKKYRKFIKMMTKLKRSDTHMSIERTKNKLEDVHGDSDSELSDDDDDDDDDWDKKCMWKSAIEVRKMAIYDNIVDNFEEEDSVSEEEIEEEEISRKRKREIDEEIVPDMPELKRQKENTPKQLWNYRSYHNPVMSEEQLQQLQEASARQYIPM